MFAKSAVTVTEEEVKGEDMMGDDDGQEMEDVDDEDKVANTEPTFKTWQANLNAQTNCMRVLLKLADFIDTSKVSADEDGLSDEDFEDCEDMDEETEGVKAQVIDLDAQKM